jgi:hypothetical protein
MGVGLGVISMPTPQVRHFKAEKLPQAGQMHVNERVHIAVGVRPRQRGEDLRSPSGDPGYRIEENGFKATLRKVTFEGVSLFDRREPRRCHTKLPDEWCLKLTQTPRPRLDRER